MRTFALLTALLALDAASAFSPREAFATGLWGVPKETTTTSALQSVAGDDNFEGLNLKKLLSAKQLKRMARINKRKANQANKPAAVKESPRSTPKKASSGSKDPVKIIIAGAPASGKGTQCEGIQSKFGVVHLSTGDMLRAAVEAQTEVGKLAKEYMDGGKLVPDEVIIGVVKDRLDQEDCKKNGWLLDGFPRTQAQAAALADAGISADCFLFLNVPDEMLVDRVVGRRTDPETGKIYHMTFSPPTDDAVIGRLVHRSDDTEEMVKVRLEQFHANVDAVKDSYTDISVTIDGNQDKALVSKAIFEAIGSKVSV